MTLALWSRHEGCTIIERVKYWQYYQEETLRKGYQAKRLCLVFQKVFDEKPINDIGIY
jgi:hypothetical protein